MIKHVYCLRKRRKAYDYLLVINEVKLLFDAEETARQFAEEYAKDHYIDQEVAWPWQRVFSQSDIGNEEWVRCGQSCKKRMPRPNNYNSRRQGDGTSWQDSSFSKFS